MSATRLLVLGAIRVMQPVHGYDVRRELISWRVEATANVKPGSIYGAIGTLERDGCVAVFARESGDSGPARTLYHLTPAGEQEFQILLREAWWTVSPLKEPLIPALSLLPFLPREELVRALRMRITTLQRELDDLVALCAGIKDGATGADGQIPEHVREIFHLNIARSRAEIDWAKRFQRRLRAGDYTLIGEPGFPERVSGETAPRKSNLTS